MLIPPATTHTVTWVRVDEFGPWSFVARIDRWSGPSAVDGSVVGSTTVAAHASRPMFRSLWAQTSVGSYDWVFSGAEGQGCGVGSGDPDGPWRSCRLC